jgi:Leucine-rich repeat (LRR) protein
LTVSRYLDLADNCITSLPKEVCTLTQLSTLLLQHNKLTQLPHDLGNLTGLEVLKLHDNQIAALPETIENLTSLVELYPVSIDLLFPYLELRI